MLKNKIASKDKVKKWVKIAEKVVAAVTIVSGVVYIVYNCLEDEEGDNKMKKSWLKSASEEQLREKKAEIITNTDWRSGSILDGDFDSEINALDAIDEEINERSWNDYKNEDHSKSDYGVHREHGWYLPNEDD